MNINICKLNMPKLKRHHFDVMTSFKFFFVGRLVCLAFCQYDFTQITFPKITFKHFSCPALTCI